MNELAIAFALVLARVGTFINVLPLLGGANVPRLVKVGLSLALTFVFIGDSSATVANVAGLGTWAGFALALGREVLFGTVLGFAMGLLLLPAHVAAEFITQEAGLSFASVITASGDSSANALTVTFEMLASLVFFALDLHHNLLLLLQKSLESMPIGQRLHMPNWDLVGAVGAAQEGGLLLIAPIAICLFLTTVVLALMTRAAPQLNLYSIGFPLKVLVCLGAMLIMMPQVIGGLVSLFGDFLRFLHGGG